MLFGVLEDGADAFEFEFEDDGDAASEGEAASADGEAASEGDAASAGLTIKPLELGGEAGDLQSSLLLASLAVSR